MNWWTQVMGFAAKMDRRFYEQEKKGWSGFEDITEEEYQRRAIKNISKGDYVDAANLCMLAFMVKKEKERIAEDN